MLNREHAAAGLCVPASRSRAAALPPPPPAQLPTPVCPPGACCQIFREVKFFGDAEISTLKKELEAHKLQLEQLKQARAVPLVGEPAPAASSRFWGQLHFAQLPSLHRARCPLRAWWHMRTCCF